jgi:hypothetical protein
MTDDDALLGRKMAAVKAVNSEADDLADFLASLDGDAAAREGSQERRECFEWVWRQPKYDKAARAALWTATK